MWSSKWLKYVFRVVRWYKMLCFVPFAKMKIANPPFAPRNATNLIGMSTNWHTFMPILSWSINSLWFRCFENYKFTGTLRPYPRKPRISVSESVNKPDYADTGIPLSEQMSKRAHTIISYPKDQIQVFTSSNIGNTGSLLDR